jgi:hypothetical protein
VSDSLSRVLEQVTVVVYIDPRIGSDLLDDIVQVGGGRQSGADVEEPAHARVVGDGLSQYP